MNIPDLNRLGLGGRECPREGGLRSSISRSQCVRQSPSPDPVSGYQGSEQAKIAKVLRQVF